MVRKILQLKNKIVCFFSGHTWKGVEGSWRPTGNTTLNWALRVVPEYEREEQCTCCEKIRTERYISLVDSVREPNRDVFMVRRRIT